MAEEEQYLQRSLKAAANACADLVPCPQPGCEGMAVAGKGEARTPGQRVCQVKAFQCLAAGTLFEVRAVLVTVEGD